MYVDGELITTQRRTLLIDRWDSRPGPGWVLALKIGLDVQLEQPSRVARYGLRASVCPAVDLEHFAQGDGRRDSW